jgi:hypothetical protein
MRRLLHHKKAAVRLISAIILAVVAAAAGVAALPLIEAATKQANRMALFRDLDALRSQIELYKAEHGGKPPVIYHGSLPQLVRATNGKGILGEHSSKFPYGPYLPDGVPTNAITGCSIVTPCDTFPPTVPSGNGGWLYNPRTGQIAADVEEFLSR